MGNHTICSDIVNFVLWSLLHNPLSHFHSHFPPLLLPHHLYPAPLSCSFIIYLALSLPIPSLIIYLPFHPLLPPTPTPPLPRSLPPLYFPIIYLPFPPPLPPTPPLPILPPVFAPYLHSTLYSTLPPSPPLLFIYIHFALSHSAVKCEFFFTLCCVLLNLLYQFNSAVLGITVNLELAIFIYGWPYYAMLCNVSLISTHWRYMYYMICIIG